eukprot:CAMPEP_0119012792 /NCGR_PEP_ID=MMETSP1176-20130426/7604_1 /TAXON_ID=265551 /ORGANISM="Synedropsis recta cf, Strain CCMP1620" /LENGTH=408 /DNA_ID=CAMNT_0006965819 /DNA_START=37 /DNA_END=1263 /DNA_ORIENTATION=+
MDSYTVTTRQGWGGRLGGSTKGVCCGPIMMIIACVLLFWNEGRAVARYKDLQESANLVVSIDDISSLNSDMEGKLVHMTGDAVPDTDLQDSIFGVITDGLKLRRDVQMYQWVETSSSKTAKNTGGSTKTVTKYTYNQAWRDTLVHSNNFNQPRGHTNPSYMEFEKTAVSASTVNFGAHSLSSGIMNAMNWFTSMESVSLESIPQGSSAENAKLVGNNVFYFGDDPAYPTIGDTKVTFDYVPSGTVSLMAVQTGDTFSPYTTSRGGSVMFVRKGIVSAEDMLLQAEQDNEMFTWVLRIVGFFLMYFGFSAVLQPLIVFADFFPLIGNILAEGVVPCLAFVVTSAIASLVVAISWLYYRPLLGVALLLVSSGLSYFIYKHAKENQESPIVSNSERYEMVKTQVVTGSFDA